MLLSNDEFLTSLTLMFYDGRSKGPVCMTVKRYDGRDRPTPRAGSPSPSASVAASTDGETQYMCLLRATRKNKKISTVVRSSEVERFHETYAKLLVSSMDALKRQKKPKTKRAAQ